MNTQFDPRHCGDCTTDCDGLTCFDGSCANLRVVFVTSASFAGAELGSVENADRHCMAAAMSSADVPRAQYKAWLSDGMVFASSRLTPADVPHWRPDREVVATGWPEFVDGALQAPIAIDEHSALVELPVMARAWTGTNAVGVGTGHDCNGWTSSSESGTVGRPDAVSSEWSDTLGRRPCGERHHLYCVQQSAGL